MQVHLMVLAPKPTPFDQTLKFNCHNHPLLLSLPIQLYQFSEKLLPFELKWLQSAVGTAIGYAFEVGETEYGLTAKTGDGGLYPFRADYAGIFGLVGSQLGESTLH